MSSGNDDGPLELEIVEESGNGLSEKARRSTNGLADVVAWFGGIWAAIWGWFAKNPSERGIMVGLGAIVVVLCMFLFGGSDKKPVVAPPPTTNRMPTSVEMVAHSGDYLVEVGKQYGVSREDIVAANIDLIRKNTVRSAGKPKGKLFGRVSEWHGEMLAVDTLYEGDEYAVPCTGGDKAPRKCQQVATSKN
ncbi:MAG: hypothetical protein AAB473_04320 [Patescibacteria group bacterium]